jgi:hypothetical protein
MFLSCSFFEPNVIVIWTDQPEFVLYARLFNENQDRYYAEVQYVESLAQQLNNTKEYPDIAVGYWLKNTVTRNLFRQLNNNTEDFYTHLLELGKVEEKQYLLPVSFNIPALVFSQKNAARISNYWTIPLEEIQELAREYTVLRGGVYTQIGFSPDWDDAFLSAIIRLFGIDFREGTPLEWNKEAFEEAMIFLHTWVHQTITNAQAADDFLFKYFAEPPATRINSGHILFTAMDSATFFKLRQESRAALDFHWITDNDSIPVIEETVYYGICKKGRAPSASQAFTEWFFNTDTQRMLIEENENLNIHDTHFGISNGFSGMRTVSEQVFPLFYPELLAHIPPEEFLSPPNVLPPLWTQIKKNVILPYIRERIKTPDQADERSLERRINDWYRLNAR